MQEGSAAVTRRLTVIQQSLVLRHGGSRRQGPGDDEPGVPQRQVAPHFVMHSSQVRDENFSVMEGGAELDLRSFLPNVNRLTRVGVVAPETGTEAAGAASLILALITAFYDDLRATGPTDFFAYPDFFVFQPKRTKPAPYSMFGTPRVC